MVHHVWYSFRNKELVQTTVRIVMCNCKHADHSCSFRYYDPICASPGVYGGKMCIHKVTPCPDYEERDTLDEIVATLDCMPSEDE